MPEFGAELQDETIVAVYDAIRSPDRWQAAVTRIASLLAADAAILDYRYDGEQEFAICCAHGVTGKWRAIYRNDLAVRFRHSPLFARTANGRIFTDAELEKVPGSGVWPLDEPVRDFIASRDFTHFGGVPLLHDGEESALLLFFRRKGRRPFTSRVLGQLERLVPHLRHALRIHRETMRLRMQLAATLASLERGGIGLVLLDRRGRMVFTSRKAASMLKDHPVLSVQNGVLRTHDREQNQQLQGMIAAATEGRRNTAEAIGIRHNCLPYPLPMMVMPLENAEPHLPRDAAVRVAVYVADPSRPHRLSAVSLQRVYGLTQAEASVAIGIADGWSLDQIAENNGVSVHTVRSQLKAVFLKTGANRQNELAKLLLTSPLPTVYEEESA